MSNVRNYTNRQLLARARKVEGYTSIPKGYWLLGVQSNEDAYNEFDDKFYVFMGTKFIMVLTGTTNAGASALMNYKKYNPLGTAVLKTNCWFHNIWAPGLHKKKMKCLKQVRPMQYYRDSNKNKKAEQGGKLYNKLIGCEFHTATYTDQMNFIRKFIGGWSAVCQVANDTGEYYKALDMFWTQKFTSYCLLEEFEV